MGGGFEPVVVVVTVRLPLPLPVGVQLSEKGACAVAPECTVTVCELDPLAVQFAAMPNRATE